MSYRAYGKCSICGKWMSREEAEASEGGSEDHTELMCNSCWYSFELDLDPEALLVGEIDPRTDAGGGY